MKCLKQDENCHWYLIELEDKDLFTNLLEQEETDDDSEFESKFGDKRLYMHISNYCFDNFREIE